MRPTQQDEADLEELVALDGLKEQDRDLLESLSEQDQWSYKQAALFDVLWKRLKGEEPRRR